MITMLISCVVQRLSPMVVEALFPTMNFIYDSLNGIWSNQCQEFMFRHLEMNIVMIFFYFHNGIDLPLCVIVLCF